MTTVELMTKPVSGWLRRSSRHRPVAVRITATSGVICLYAALSCAVIEIPLTTTDMRARIQSTFRGSSACRRRNRVGCSLTQSLYEGSPVHGVGLRGDRL